MMKKAERLKDTEALRVTCVDGTVMFVPPDEDNRDYIALTKGDKQRGQKKVKISGD